MKKSLRFLNVNYQKAKIPVDYPNYFGNLSIMEVYNKRIKQITLRAEKFKGIEDSEINCSSLSNDIALLFDRFWA